MKKTIISLATLLLLNGCNRNAAPAAAYAPTPAPASSSYFDNTGRADVLAGAVRMIPVQTPKGTYRVWTKRIGNNPRIKVLLLHGGPGVTHEYLSGPTA